jgi:hypothetical protein
MGLLDQLKIAALTKQLKLAAAALDGVSYQRTKQS